MPEPKVYRRQNGYAGAVDEDSRIVFLPVAQIKPNRAQPRKRFDTNTMIRLADSVRRYGVLQPLTVRRPQNAVGDGCYELIAGERRLRAAKLAGLTQVPCILTEVDDHLSAELAIIENLLREDLNMFEQAKAFGRLIVQFSFTQEQVARKMSMSQSAVANKLRLLRLSEKEQALILENDLTERHARALLRISDPEKRVQTIQKIAAEHVNVSSTEEYVDKLLSEKLDVGKGVTDKPTADNAALETQENAQNAGKIKVVLKDLRIFYNSIENAVEILRKTGVKVDVNRQEGKESVHIDICMGHMENVD